MNGDLERNKCNATAFYDLMFDGDDRAEAAARTASNSGAATIRPKEKGTRFQGRLRGRGSGARDPDCNARIKMHRLSWCTMLGGRIRSYGYIAPKRVRSLKSFAASAIMCGAVVSTH